MFGYDCQFFFDIGERRLDDQIFQILNTIDRLPQCIARRRVAAEYQAGLAAFDMETDRRNHVVRRQRRDLAPVYIHRLAQHDALIAQKWAGADWDLGEVRPYFPIENMFFEDAPASRR